MMILMKIIWIDDDHLSPYSSCPSSLQELAPPLLPTKPYKGVLGCFFIFFPIVYFLMPTFDGYYTIYIVQISTCPLFPKGFLMTGSLAGARCSRDGKDQPLPPDST